MTAMEIEMFGTAIAKSRTAIEKLKSVMEIEMVGTAIEMFGLP